jgi:flagellar protein FliS
MMPNSAYEKYRESEILAADPLKLVELLYRAAIQSITDAREHLRSGKIRERSNAISKAAAILSELMQSLDHDRGGEITRNLAELYDYMQRQLLKANMEQIESPLIEVNKLMATLLEGWQACSAATPTAGKKSYETQHAPIACNF